MKTPSNLGVKEGQLASMPNSPNAVSSQTDLESYYVEPIPFKVDLETTKKAILSAVTNYGDGEIKTDDSNYIHIVFTTSAMKYHDDVEFYFDEEARVVHFRSASRIGYSDMGLNRDRYEALLTYYIAH
jgi:uncharacterized protein (DUF1499 family)